MKQFCIFISILSFVACIKQEYKIDDKLPEPFRNEDTDVSEIGTIDSSSFFGIHSYILEPTCAVSGCHDGSFEPDFRTVQSAYNTLVNNKAVKNTTDDNRQFEFRVVPNNIEQSMLYERLTTEDQTLGRMPLYDFPLTSFELKHIENWINAGAPDGFGNSPKPFNEEPSFFGMLAYLVDSNITSLIDRDPDISIPYEFPKDTIIEVWLGLFDIDDDGEYYPGHELQYNRYKISDTYYDFSNAQFKDLTVENVETYLAGPSEFEPDSIVRPYFHHFTLNTYGYSSGDIRFIRAYVQDSNHSTPTEIPEYGSPIYMNTYFSFKIVD